MRAKAFNFWADRILSAAAKTNQLLALGLTILLIASPAASGCAAALPAIISVASVIAKITGIVDLIESQAEVASGNGLLPPEVARRITAVRAVVARLNDAAQASPAVYAAAVAEFERLYAELTAVVAPLGVRVAPVDGRLSAEPGTVAVPPASELRAELEREGR